MARVLRRGGRHDQERGRRSRAVMVEHVPRTERDGHRGGELPGLQEAECSTLYSTESILINVAKIQEPVAPRRSSPSIHCSSSSTSVCRQLRVFERVR
jgi:hypothetical protein